MATELENMDVLRLSNNESNQVTRECLRIAMFKLMGKKPFEKISITELAKCAGVSRVAFYRNYESKEALVQDLCQSVYLELKASLQGDTYKNDRHQWYVNFFQTIKSYKQYYRIYLDARLRLAEGSVLETVTPSSSTQQYYEYIGREGAYVSILTDWFENGMQESPEEMADICTNIFFAEENRHA